MSYHEAKLFISCNTLKNLQSLEKPRSNKKKTFYNVFALSEAQWLSVPQSCACAKMVLPPTISLVTLQAEPFLMVHKLCTE